MNYKTIALSTFCFFTLAFVIACGAQNDSLRTDESLIEELMKDPLTKKVNDVHQSQTDLIMYNSLDVEAIGEVIETTPDHDVCKITQDISHIKHAVEYFDNMCTHITLMREIKQKYPHVTELDPEVLAKIFFNSRQVSTEDILLMIESRNKID